MKTITNTSDLKFERIQTTEHKFFMQVWRLYKKSFPAEERRQLRTQKKIMNNPIYHFELITKEERFIGFIFWWEFNNMLYIEHLATQLCLRGKGYGLQILKYLMSRQNKSIILEVEHPTDNISKRRIEFYRRAGFVLNTQPYKHPPYKKGGEYVSLMLMTYPDAIKEEELNEFTGKHHLIIHEYVLKT